MHEKRLKSSRISRFSQKNHLLFAKIITAKSTYFRENIRYNILIFDFDSSVEIEPIESFDSKAIGEVI